MLKKIFLALSLIVVLPLLAGCANYGKEHLFDARSEVEAEKKLFSPPPAGLASVYLISKKNFMQEISYLPVPAMGFIVNDRIVTIAPRGSFVHLLFQPGRHKIGLMGVPEVMGKPTGTPGTIVDVVSVDVAADRTYFVDTEIAFMAGYKLKVSTSDDKRELVRDARLAKTIHVPISLAPFEKRQQELADAKRRKEEDEARQRAARELQRAQTAEGVSDFFATAASIAVIALFVVGFGLAVSAGQSANTPPLPLAQMPSPPAYVTSATTVRSASGRTMQLETSKNSQTTSINNLSTGVRYRMEGDRYVGTDGSWYRMSGNTIYSSTGNYYTRSGNLLTSNDGRQCQIIGSMINCN